MVFRYRDSKEYFGAHRASKFGAIVTTVMLSSLLIMVVLGRATLDFSALHIPDTPAKRVIAMRIKSIDTSQDSLVVQEVHEKRSESIPSFTLSPKKIIKAKESTKASTQVSHVEKPLPVIAPKENISEALEGAKEGLPDTSTKVKKIIVKNDPIEIDKTIAMLLGSVEENKKYPRAARRGGYEGIVEILVTLNTKGHIVTYSLNKSSGYRILDLSALDLLEELKKIRFSAGNLVENITIIIPIRYNLGTE